MTVLHLLLFVDFFVLLIWHMNHSLDSPIFIAAIVHNGKRTKVKSLHIVLMRSELYELPAHAVTRSVGRTRDNEALLRDSGTPLLFAGQSRGMWDGWQVCSTGHLAIAILGLYTSTTKVHIYFMCSMAWGTHFSEVTIPMQSFAGASPLFGGSVIRSSTLGSTFKTAHRFLNGQKSVYTNNQRVKKLPCVCCFSSFLVPQAIPISPFILKK